MSRNSSILQISVLRQVDLGGKGVDLGSGVATALNVAPPVVERAFPLTQSAGRVRNTTPDHFYWSQYIW